MSSHTGTVLSCDHTFRTSKHIGVTREDGKFVKQFQNVFLGLNEYGEVWTWRYTRSTVSSEIEDLLKELKDRLDKAEKAENFSRRLLSCGTPVRQMFSRSEG